MKDSTSLPLIFDMDGVWVSSDVSLELLLHYLKANPFRGPFRALAWAWQGKAVLKHNLEKEVGATLDVDSLPVNDGLRHMDVYKLAEERVLVSGSSETVVSKVAARNPDFRWSQGSCADRNLVGTQKAAFLQQRYPDGFAYVGDSTADVAVWRAAKRAYAVHPSKRAVRQASRNNIELEVLEDRPEQWPALLESMRLHQWSKNSLVFLMVFLNLALVTPQWIALLAAAFVSFGLIASATYILNDLLDLQADRRHPTKRERPLASGRLHLKTAVVAMVGLAVGGFAIAIPVGWNFVAMLAGYAAISLVYSFRLKRVVVLDAIVLSLLFCWRVLAGGMVIDVEMVPWFTASLAFFFLSLALGKRGIELKAKIDEPRDRKADAINGRGYTADDYPIVLGLGLASGLGSAIVTLIYALLTPGSIISHPLIAFGVCGILTYWLGYVWLMINRGSMHHDPIIFALKDKQSLFVLGLLGAMMAAGQVL